MLDELSENIHQLSSLVLRHRTTYDNLVSENLKLEREIEGLEDEIQLLKLVEQALLSLSSNLTEQVSKEIENLVNVSLIQIFDDMHIKIEIEPVISGKTTGLKIKIIKDGYELGDLEDSEAGGVISVISVLLRVICIILSDARRILILDEAFAQVSEQYLESVGKVLKSIADEMGFTIILVTHKPTLTEYSDTHYHLDKSFKKIK